MKKVILFLTYNLFLLIVSCGGGGSSSGGNSNHQITYQLTGSATKVLITLTTPNGGTTQFSGVSTPWSQNYTFPSGSFVYIEAVIVMSSGSITVSIDVDGKLWKQTSSSGANVSAMVSGTI